jgi:putative polyhydroxyalkanoate system protein
MADLSIRREHALGLDEARRIATEWAQQAAERFSMDCVQRGEDDRHLVDFTRSGVRGQLVVTADSFELEAQLGFLLKAYRVRIEQEIARNLDGLLAAR